jgi:hypothetical protein
LLEAPNPFSRAFQLAYVTRDIDRAAAMIAREHGVTDFTSIPATELELRIPRESCVSLAVRVAWTGSWQLELIQPIDGAVDIYADELAADADSLAFHHVGILVPGERAAWDSFRATIPDNRVAIEGGREQMRFIYTDERDTLGHYVEYVWMSEAFVTANPIWRPARVAGAPGPKVS